MRPRQGLTPLAALLLVVQLLLLCTTVLCGGKPANVTVRTQVKEDYALRAVFPRGWAVPASLQQLIPAFMR